MNRMMNIVEHTMTDLSHNIYKIEIFLLILIRQPPLPNQPCPMSANAAVARSPREIPISPAGANLPAVLRVRNAI